METIVIGSKEQLMVTLVDRKEAITDLAPLTPLYDVQDKDDAFLMQNQAVVTDGLTCYCLIDTTVGTWASGIYRLFIKFTAAPEVPVHGPFPFRVEER